MWSIAINRLTALQKTQNWSIWLVHYISLLRPKLMYDLRWLWILRTRHGTHFFVLFKACNLLYYYYLIKMSPFAFHGRNKAYIIFEGWIMLLNIILYSHTFGIGICSRCLTAPFRVFFLKSTHVLLEVECGLNIVWNRSWHSFPVQLQCVESLISSVLCKSGVLKLYLFSSRCSDRFRQLEVLQQVTTTFSSLVGANTQNVDTSTTASRMSAEARERRKRMAMILRRASKKSLSQAKTLQNQHMPSPVTSSALSGPESSGMSMVDKRIHSKRTRMSDNCLSH